MYERMDLLKVALLFIGILIAAGGILFALNWFRSGAFGVATGGRGRQPRLAVIDAAMVDARRKLVLIRRDNVEHLIMIGGPSDVVIEPNIVRAIPAAPAREAPPARVTPSLADTLPRPVPLADGDNWPLQPAEPPPRPQRAMPPPPPAPAPKAVDEEDEEAARDPDWTLPEVVPPPPPPPRVAPASRAEPRMRAEPPLRPEPPVRAEPPPVRAEPMLRAVPDSEPITRPERPQRAARPQNPDRLAGLASELSRNFMDSDLSSPPSPPPRAAEGRRPPPPVQPVAPPAPPVQDLPELHEVHGVPEHGVSDAEENLTEMAQRLESALHRPRPAPEPAPATAPPALRAVELPRIEPAPRADPKPPRAEPAAPPAPAPAKPAAKAANKPPLGSLEQEMASLLGRSSGKS